MTKLDKNQELAVGNLVARGMKLQDAIKKVTTNTEAPAAPGGKAKKPTTKERKESMGKEIEALGGEVPDAGASVAKFTEALTAAKAVNDEAEETEDLM